MDIHWERVGGAIVLAGAVLGALAKWVLKPIARQMYYRRMQGRWIKELRDGMVLPDGRLVGQAIPGIERTLKVIQFRVGRQELITADQLERMNTAVFVCDREGEFTSVSMPLAHMIGCTLEELRGFGYKTHIAMNGMEEGVEFHRALQDQRFTELDGVITTMSGDRVEVSVRLAPHQLDDNNKVDEFVGIVRKKQNQEETR